ncbi:transcription elongation factor spt4 [Neocucurbitaria cava]|uniref:Transcription elongation factor SPT4 n=1 Tax=Neocucurbitaria cava TaxID=798079 RepID=A0A9W9CM77_9PLEO|nr:transcription elongation factor spt4 [Neocucurbitaria cava]
MGRKGTAKVRKASRDDKFIFLNSDDEDIGPPTSASEKSKVVKSNTPVEEQELENVDPEAAREHLKLPKPKSPGPYADPGFSQPRQASTTIDQRKTLVDSRFSSATISSATNEILSATKEPEHTSKPAENHRAKQKQPLEQARSRLPRARTRPVGANTQSLIPNPAEGSQNPRDALIPQDNGTMSLPGGAAIPPNQQRNMRACMVCSIVRTQQQFMTHGCPNCEEILELTGNSEAVSDCTSQVFDGLISVADTNKSWVARYQRLEGYVAGVYATQVEGILPEEVIVAVENAGINYVPRDGSEQDMLPKD